MSRQTLLVLALGLPLAVSVAQAETPLERGAYLMNSIVACGNCHTPQTPNGPQTGMELAGQKVLDDPGLLAWAPNITPDGETGVGDWTDEQLVRAIREGVRPDGSLIGPPMPFHYYRQISDSDVSAIVAYLRTVPAVKNETPKSEYGFPLPPSYGPPVANVPDVPRDDRLRYGEYLVGALGHCFECHSPLVNGQPDVEHQLGAGGLVLNGPWGTVVSPNITPHPEDGIAHYSDEEVKTAISKGLRPDGSRLSPPMGYHYYANILPEDLDAIVAYLRTIPPKPFPK